MIVRLAWMNQNERDQIDEIFKKWESHVENVKKDDPEYNPCIYSFLYWLVRYSGYKIALAR